MMEPILIIGLSILVLVGIIGLIAASIEIEEQDE